MALLLSPTRTPSALARLAIAGLLFAVAASGCARLPRIDPTGERIFLWPDQQPPGMAAAAPTFAPTPSNVVAPPVFAADQSPGLLGLGVLGDGGCLDRAVNGPTVIGPAVGVPQPGTPVAAGPVRSRVAGAVGLQDRVSGDRVVITPQRVLAPVGTEVIVRAGVCGEDGYLRTNRRIDWLLGKQGVGEFVQVGEEGERDIGRLPWRAPEKHDNHYAVGYTSPFHTCLRRGNADRLDDIQVRKGDAWITVSSAQEGTSYVTAAAKSVDNWDTRRASTVIYWIDAQWQFPAPATVEAGRPHTLTTVVTRQSDGAPIEGWIVRYEVVDPNAARLGYDAGQASEATTDNRGRASVEVTPTDPNQGATTINVTVVRPEQAGLAASPRINVGQGATTITWGAGVATPTPPPVLPPIDNPPAPPTPPNFQPPGDNVPIPPQPTGRPQLEVSLRQLTPDPIKEGDPVAFDVLVQNRGDGFARNLKITDRFDAGLAHAGDTQGRNAIEYTDMRDLGPGESDSIRLEFSVLQAGRREHRVTVTADGPPGGPPVSAFDDAVFTATALAPPAPTLDVQFLAPVPVQVTSGGEAREFRCVVQNTGPTPATNVVLRFRSDARFLRVTGHEPVRPDLGETLRRYNEASVQVIEFTIARLDPGARHRELRFACVGEQDTPQARVTIEATADGGGDAIDEAIVEVLPAPAGADLGGPNPGGGPVAPASPVEIRILESANPTTVGRTQTLNAIVTNIGSTVLRDVELQVYLPEQFEPQLKQIVPQTATPFPNRTLNFAAIAQLRPNEETRVLIPILAAKQGLAGIEVNVRSPDLPSGATLTRQVTVNPR